MKKGNVFVSLLKLFGVCILGWLIWVFIFSAFTPDDVEIVPDSLVRLSVILGLATGFVISIGLNYNSATRKRSQLKASASNILIVEERGSSLLEKANRVVEKYLSHEKEVFAGTGGRHVKPVKDAGQFQHLIESYPELKSNTNISELLDQIKGYENNIMNVKLTYNSNVQSYNTLINSLPLSLFKKFFKFSEAEYYQKKAADTELTDEMLGL